MSMTMTMTMTMEEKPLLSAEIVLRQVVLEAANLASTEAFRTRAQQHRDATSFAFPEVRFGYRCGFSMPAPGQAWVRLDLSLDAMGGDGTEQLGLSATYQLAFCFELPTWVDYLERNKLFDLGQAAKMVLASISFSTARGILSERAQGTYFAGFILPIISPGDLISAPADGTLANKK